MGFVGWAQPTPVGFVAFRLRLNDSMGAVTMPVPSGGTVARLLVSGRTDAAAVTETNINVIFNGDTTASAYQWSRISNSNASVTGAEDASDPQIVLPNALPGASSAANICSAFELIVFDYTGPFFKTVFAHNSHQLTTGATNRRITIVSGFYSSTNPIASITLTPASGNFIPGTLFRLVIEA